jgi:putative membrane protein
MIIGEATTMHWGDYGWGMGFGWGMGLSWLFFILFWVLIILGAIYLIKLIARGGRTKTEEETPLDILKRRYARGEISKDEFERIKEDLKNN